ncbi:DNA polymerase I [Gemella sanguinis M325]|jgi:DNA-directed DNA polymerase|uniref:DNA polymerase I n=1 Tax=Gemella sanguinis TaxID=84135 RepID=A0ABX6FKJ8_9BACL|nr:DNA polymerase I [Gemella sanguinis]EGF89039.1 DNA polymerase I [Gemella sanguinis M325]QGS07828.1 DNA polymerase I [Gemella sanguinis]
MDKIILLDGNSLSYRAFYAMPALKNKKGLYTNSVYGFTLMLERILEDTKPKYALVAFDKGKETFRHKSYEAYKGTRDKTPTELVEQFGYVRELIESYGIKYEEHLDYEADDIIGSYAKIAEKAGLEVIIVSGDKDLTQLASDNITVYYTKRGVTEIDYYTPEFINEKYGLTPQQIIDMKGLMGDKSDNIPGIPGVGEKTAIKLLTEYENVENVLENIDNISGKKLKERLTEGKEDAILSKKLATIFTDVPVDNKIEDLTFKEDREKKKELFEKLEFVSFLRKLSQENSAADESETETKEEKIKKDIEIQIADKDTKLNFKKSSLHIECYTEDYQNSDVLGVSVYVGDTAYIFSEENFFDNKYAIEYLQSQEEKTVYDIKKIIYIAKKNNKKINGDVFDIKIANYLIDVTSKSEIDKIVFNYLGEIISSNEEIYGKGAKRSLPTQEVLNSYIAKIAASILEVKPLMIKSLEEENMLDLYKNIEIKVARVLANMEFEGIHVSKKALDEMSHEFDERIKVLEGSIYTLAGSEFNIASPKQLGVVLFEDLGLPVVKKTKTGYSTAVEVLEQLQYKHDIIPLIMEYRTLTKLNSTYAKGLVKDITREGKIHTRYEQTLTQTGRLSSVNPNLQNIPTRIEEGKKIRKAFIPASNDRVILSIDYSQIELRVLAHIAQDKGMIDAFKHDVDIHTKTASDVNGVPLDEVTPTMRREAKAVNFGIVYGISDFGLSNNLGITRKRAKEFIEKYLETFKGVDKYMTDIVKFAKEHGYVETLYNRRRSLPEINAKNKIIANLNARIAMNTPIQGTAADIIKIAMISAYNYIEESKVDAKLLLQVHDELIFDVSKDILEEFTDKMVAIMEEAANLDVKLKAEASSGPSWYEAK